MAMLESRLPLPEQIMHDQTITPLHVVTSMEGARSALAEHAMPMEAWAKVQGFEARPGQVLLVPDGRGQVAAALVACETSGDGLPRPSFVFGSLPNALSAGTYRLANPIEDEAGALTAFLLGGYSYTRFKPVTGKRAQVALVCDGHPRATALLQARGVIFARDLINTPANHLGPVALAQSAQSLADAFGASFSMIVGQDLLDEANPFPMIHTVGMAAAEEPRLVDFTWSGGGPDAPRVTLVGKGVCFDSGGLNIKPGSNMALMKKDMGGAAAVLGLAMMIMQAGLPLRLRVLIPCVENAISAQAFRPGDVLASRKGLSVEIGNTDAEGRLVLADALALADEEAPDLLIDMATLTGAARVALGPDLPPFYTDDEALAAQITEAGMTHDDPVWRMPLWKRYESMIAGSVGEISNSGASPFAGSITAALFLRRFVGKARSWVHFDIFGWMPSARPGRPEGGEAQAIRALFNLLASRYASKD